MSSPAGVRGLRALLLQAVLLHASYSVVRPMVSYRALDMGAGSAELGALAASFAVLPLLLAFAVGRQADVLGPARLVLAGAVLMVLGSLVALRAGGIAVLLVASAALGLAHLMAMVGQQSMVAGSASETERDRGFGSVTAAASVGQMLGPPVALTAAGYLATSARSEAAVGLTVAAGFALAAVPLGAYRRGRTARRPAERPAPSGATLSRLVRTDGMWQAMVASGSVLAALDLLMAFLPAWAEERGVSVAAVGWLLALRAAVSVVTRAGVVRLIDVFTRRGTLVGSLVLGVLGFAVLPFVGVVGAAVVMCLLGVGLGLAQPLTLSWVTTRSAPAVRGAAIGLRLTANRLAQTVLPPSIGFAVKGSGTSGVFLACAVVLGLAAIPVLRAPLSGPVDGPPDTP